MAHFKLAGRYDRGSESITYTGTPLDPMVNKEVPMREIVKFVDDRHQVMKMYMPGSDGTEYKGMEENVLKSKVQ